MENLYIRPEVLAKMPVGKVVEYKQASVSTRNDQSKITKLCTLVRWSFKGEDGFVRYAWYDIVNNPKLKHWACEEKKITITNSQG